MNDETEKLLKVESKKIVRQPIAKVKILWAGNGIDNVHAETPESNNRTSIYRQVVNGIGRQERWAFCQTTEAPELESKVTLADGICAMPKVTEDGLNAGGFLVGWWGDGQSIANANRQFPIPQILKLRFPPMSIDKIRLIGYLSGDLEKQEWPVDFDVKAYTGDGLTLAEYNDGTPAVVQIRGNDKARYTGEFKEGLTGITHIEFIITSWSHIGGFVKITAAFDDFTREYTADDIMSMSILEEAEGTVGALPIGGISCNELSLTLQNLTNQYFHGNKSSLFSALTRANRRIEPYIGFILTDEKGEPLKNEHEKEFPAAYAPKGVYWSGDWSVPDQGTGVSTTAVDRLGLLQNIEYRGVGHFADTSDDWKPEKALLLNTNLYETAVWVLEDLRLSYMPDLVFSVDPDLKEIKVPLAFFPCMSYFDLIKTIAQAGLAYVYMDTPSNGERKNAADEFNIDCVDVLRIKRIGDFIPSDDDFNNTALMLSSERITQNDILTKTTQARRSDLVNAVNVDYEGYEIDEITGMPEPNVKISGRVLKINDSSILDYGRLEYEYPKNNLIQDEKHAEDIANALLAGFSAMRRLGELSVFGDVTSKISDVWEIPEYCKDGVEIRGHYAVTRITTEYDGALRQSVSCRMVSDAQRTYKIRVNITSSTVQNVIDISAGNYAIVGNNRIDFDGNYFEFEGYRGTYTYTAYIRGIPAVSGTINVE